MVRPKVSMTSPSTGKYPSAGGMAETTRSDGGRSSELLFRPPAHLPEARAPVVRDAFENLEGRGGVVSAGPQPLPVPLRGERAPADRPVPGALPALPCAPRRPA